MDANLAVQYGQATICFPRGNCSLLMGIGSMAGEDEGWRSGSGAIEGSRFSGIQERHRLQVQHSECQPTNDSPKKVLPGLERRQRIEAARDPQGCTNQE